MKVTAEQYGDICDIIYRTCCGMPPNDPARDPFLHTSDQARDATNQILNVLNADVLLDPPSPERLQAMRDYQRRH